MNALRQALCWCSALFVAGAAAFTYPTTSRYEVQASTVTAVAGPATAFVVSNNTLIPLSLFNPSRPSPAIPLRGLADGDRVVGIDFRPQNGMLYALAQNAGTIGLYAVSQRTGVVTPLERFQTFDDGTTPVNIAGSAFGIDFNPVVDRLRIVNDAGLNFRINPNTGELIDGDFGAPATPRPGINPDGSISGAAMQAQGTAYTNNAPNATATTQYTLDAATGQLLIQNPPNSGMQVSPLPVTLNGARLNFTAVGGFDIPSGVNVSTSGNPVTSGDGFAVLTVNGVTGLYRIALATGAATLVGTVGDGRLSVQGLAIQSVPVAGGTPAVALSSDGARLLRFNTRTPATAVNLPVTGVAPNEELVGLTLRPDNGTFMALGVDAEFDTVTMYRLDPQSGAATAVNGPLFLVDGNDDVLDLPPASAGYGIDASPVPVAIFDGLIGETRDTPVMQVTTGNGLNFSVSQESAGPVAARNAFSGLPPGAAGVPTLAFTDSFMGGAPTRFSGVKQAAIYTLDPVSDGLYLQTSSATGIQTLIAQLTLGGARLDFADVAAFDISPNIRIAAAVPTGVARGRGVAALTVGGSANLYAIDLATGEARLLGQLPAGLRGLALADSLDIYTSTVGVFRPANGTVFLRNANDSGFADMSFMFPGAQPGDIPVAGDWDGDGVETVGIFRNGRFILKNNTSSLNFSPQPELDFTFGGPGDIPLAGDWDGDGVDTVGVFRNGQIFLRNSNSSGIADIQFAFGAAGDIPLAGDWNGDGQDTIGLFRSGRALIRNSNTTGPAELDFFYGQSGDRPIVGDWNGDGFDSIGVYRNGVAFLRNALSSGFADAAFNYGSPGDIPLGGDWNAQ